jgi:hypothetical protein
MFICIDLAHVNNMSSIIVNDKERNWKKRIKVSLTFSVQFEPSFPKLTSLTFSLRPSILRHVMYTIVDRYDNERETWSKSKLEAIFY